MTIRRATAADIPLILQLLRATPNPPNESEESIQAYMDDRAEFIYVDIEVPAIARLSPDTVAQEVPIPWWVWRGAFNATAHLPVLGAACRAVKASLPTSGPWPIFGDFPGAGGTDAERKADSVRQAQEHTSWLGSVTDKESPNSPEMQQARSTVDAVIAAVP